ncbi:MAG: MerR family transcriptional regulator [Pseudonocardiales bacterium]|nr:MerR family transcriptional regulator [Pseudonocardiales bacterium]MBV9728760.1 MerR family transcriptional regulator [Pseudonocardiales bacterium]
MTAPGRSGHRSGVSIGSVLTQLRADFPDVTISKIRFLESEGLVQPERTAAGYRQFSSADVERLRYVLAAQRDHYLPLRVIKEHLDALDRGEPEGPPDRCPERSADQWPRAPRPLVSARPSAAVEPGGSADLAADAVRMTQEELLAAAGIGRAVLTELEQFGLVRSGPAGFYDTDAVLVAKTAQAMTDFGLEPRHLRSFRASADREVGLLAQIVTPMSRQRDPHARARADEVIRELAVLSLRLHALLVKIGLRGVIGN